MAKPTTRALAAVLAAVGIAATLTIGAPFAFADPEPVPGDPVVVDAPPAEGLPAPELAPFDPAVAPIDPAAAPAPDAMLPVEAPAAPEGVPGPDAVPAVDAAPAVPGATASYVGPPPFLPPSFSPKNGVNVGVGKPIVINFQRPIMNRPMAESAITITSVPPATGRFYWFNDTQLRWRPDKFWAANSVVNIDAAGTKSSFTTHDALVANVDNNTHQMVITRNGAVVKTFPVSLGKKGDETPNGTYYASEKFADMWMDSSTYGVSVDSAQGYRTRVYDAVRISNTGIFVHGAPWSVGSQGNSNVSHGCINISADNAQWFYDNFDLGDPVIVKNSVGTYNQNDGYDDWQRF